MLAGSEGGPRHFGVCRGWSEIEHDLDRRVGHQLVQRERSDAMLGGERLGVRVLDVGAGGELEVEGGRVLGVILADHAATDDPDLHTTARTAASERSTDASAGPSVSSCSTSSHSTPASTAAEMIRP